MLVHVADGGHHLVEDLQDITLFQLPEKNVRLAQKSLSAQWRHAREVVGSIRASAI